MFYAVTDDLVINLDTVSAAELRETEPDDKFRETHPYYVAIVTKPDMISGKVFPVYSKTKDEARADFDALKQALLNVRPA